MKKLTLLIILITSIAKAQTFEFTCEVERHSLINDYQIPSTVYVSYGDEFWGWGAGPTAYVGKTVIVDDIKRLQGTGSTYNSITGYFPEGFYHTPPNQEISYIAGSNATAYYYWNSKGFILEVGTDGEILDFFIDPLDGECENPHKINFSGCFDASIGYDDLYILHYRYETWNENQYNTIGSNIFVGTEVFSRDGNFAQPGTYTDLSPVLIANTTITYTVGDNGVVTDITINN